LTVSTQNSTLQSAFLEAPAQSVDLIHRVQERLAFFAGDDAICDDLQLFRHLFQLHSGVEAHAVSIEAVCRRYDLADAIELVNRLNKITCGHALLSWNWCFDVSHYSTTG